jgi:hypothetical protein
VGPETEAGVELAVPDQVLGADQVVDLAVALTLARIYRRHWQEVSVAQELPCVLAWNAAASMDTGKLILAQTTRSSNIL